MKANELMIGDYLRWNGKPYRVAQVSTPTVTGDLYDGWMLENGEEDCGEPIFQVIARVIIRQQEGIYGN